MTEDTIKVCIRIRPFLESEKISSNLSPIITNEEDDETIKIGKNSKITTEKFDKIFFDTSTQNDVFKYVNFCTEEAIQGINCTLITYGQTGSGKTYTMFGKEWTNAESQDNTWTEMKKDQYDFLYNEVLIDPFNETNGIIPRMINNIISQTNENTFDIYCSYIQIYNEKIYDLLDINASNIDTEKKVFRVAGKNDFTTINPIKQKALQIREDKDKGIYIDGLTQNKVENFFDCMNYLKMGENLRKKRQTNKNELSSRSHTLFMLDLFSKNKNENDIYTASRVHFCDLAGSEKFDKNFQYNKVHFNEMKNINTSLCTLANVINALTNKSSFVPFRESKLTQILQNSLGGNSRTVIIANISPSIENYEETISTIQFAKRVKKVKVIIEPNKNLNEEVDSKVSNKIIQKLTQEVNELKQLLKIRKKNGIVQHFSDESEKEILRLRRENEELRNKLYKKNNSIEPTKISNKNFTDVEFENADISNGNYSASKINVLRQTANNVITSYSMPHKLKKKINFKNYLENNSMMRMLKDIEKENDEKLKKEIEAIKAKKYKH